jgi:hypothetical membrane protein
MIRLGGLAWLSALQFFVAQVLVAREWPGSFNLAERNISDLGATSCGALHAAASMPCSPWHGMMNASFVTIGVTMAIGGILARDAFVPGARRTMAILLFCVAGAGVVLVGLFPENTAGALHVAGAAVNFLAGNIALICFGLALPARRQRLSGFSVAAGALGLISTVLVGTGHDAGLGHGTMERLAAYPIAIWQIVAGVSLERSSSTLHTWRPHADRAG